MTNKPRPWNAAALSCPALLLAPLPPAHHVREVPVWMLGAILLAIGLAREDLGVRVDVDHVAHHKLCLLADHILLHSWEQAHRQEDSEGIQCAMRLCMTRLHLTRPHGRTFFRGPRVPAGLASAAAAAGVADPDPELRREPEARPELGPALPERPLPR